MNNDRLELTAQEKDILKKVYDRLVRGRVMERLLTNQTPWSKYFDFEINLLMTIWQRYKSEEVFKEIIESLYKEFHDENRDEFWPTVQQDYEVINEIEYEPDLVTDEELEKLDNELLATTESLLDNRTNQHYETGEYDYLDFEIQLITAIIADRDYESMMSIIDFITEFEYVNEEEI